MPTTWSGWRRWAAGDAITGPREKRVGLVHALTNGLAIGIYTASWAARLRGRHDTGARLALAGATVAGVAGYLGGHLAGARNVGSHHAAYDEVSPGTSPTGP